MKAVALVLLLVGCSSPVVATPPPLVTPPPAALNGVVGRSMSWCGFGGCVDGFVGSPDGLPRAEGLDELELPAGARLERITAWSEDREVLGYVDFDGTRVGEIPTGTAMLTISLRWADGADADYWWSLEP